MHNRGWWTYLSYDESKGAPKIDRALLLRVASWARPYRARFGAMLLLLLTISLIELVPPWLYGQLINELMPTDGGDPTLTISRLNLLAVGLLGAPMASNLLGVVQRHLSASIGEGLIYDLRVQAYTHVQRLGLRFFTETKAGDIISRFNNDVVGAQSAVTNTIPNIMTNVLTLVTTLTVMIAMEWRLTLLAVAVLPLFLLPTRRVGRVLRVIRRDAAEHQAAMSSQLQETVNVSGALLVRTFGQQADASRRFANTAEEVRDIGIRRAVIGRWFFMGLGIAGAIGTAMMYWAGGYLALQPTDPLEPGTIVAFAAYLTRLYGPLSGLSNVQVEFASSLVSFERVFEYLDLPIEIDEREDAVELEDVEGRIELDGLWFSYRADPAKGGAAAMDAPAEAASIDGVAAEDDGADAAGVATNGAAKRPLVPVVVRGRRWALQAIDASIEPGTVTALVGPSGSGKTTISYLVARLYDPTRGSITLDGHDLRDVTLASLARHVGVVTQETYLFHDTIRANLAFARPEATDAEIEAACHAANIHDHVMSLPDGYGTVVGERGYRLSGGEKQRLALARVILKDPNILVLDEATSHLDSRNEALVQEALGRVMQDRTNVVIAHRLSTVRAADQILVIKDGEIVERGTHDELLARGGLYRELHETQFSEGEARG